MVRVIANTTSPMVKTMNEMVGKTFDKYKFGGKTVKVVHPESGAWYFLKEDVEEVEYQTEDDKFRETLL